MTVNDRVGADSICPKIPRCPQMISLPMFVYQRTFLYNGGKMEIYMDNSATTKPYKEAADAVYNTMMNTYGNPSSLHRLGKQAEDLLTQCRETVAKTLSTDPRDLYFTSGGTESDNIAVLGYAYANRRSGMRVITQKTEHAAVLEPFKKLEADGFDVVYIGVDSNGFPNIDELKSAVNDDTILMSFMYVNNENGAIFPMEEIASCKKSSKCALHVDAVQAYGKININPKRLRIDMLSISSHKIHGPNGVGALYIKNSLKISPVIFGGHQEKNIRSGTENLAGIAGFAKAAEIKFKNMQADAEKITGLKNRLRAGLVSEIDNVVINTPENSVSSILNVSFPGVKSEVLLHVLESYSVYVSSGSACNSKKSKFSYVLREMGLKDNEADSAVRFSLSEFNTEEEIDRVCEILKEEIPKLRKIMR